MIRQIRKREMRMSKDVIDSRCELAHGHEHWDATKVETVFQGDAIGLSR